MLGDEKVERMWRGRCGGEEVEGRSGIGDAGHLRQRREDVFVRRVMRALILAVVGFVADEVVGCAAGDGETLRGGTDLKYPTTGRLRQRKGTINRSGLVRTHQSIRAHTRTHIVSWRRIGHAADYLCECASEVSIPGRQ